MRIRVIILKPKVIIIKGKNVFDIGIEGHSRQLTRAASQLHSDLLEMIMINVCIAKRMHKFADLQPRNLSHHHKQQRI